ncbi:hypothetical protein RFI_17364 [Reticulomyxa filosa]|uniref:DNA-directed DNA polymerase n=1 Tax=Reticulomyxa filosa TaxID=46433 RepID=X6N1D4_RETFI|nr:hypothetical protein RFI_17364 [Reticulomyxa filosa]|eukprot:ETO19856.1 hypothetical protein RFI_17364 [Reticulomyxa filosa]
MSSQTPLESATNLLLNRTSAEISDLNVHFSYQFVKVGDVMFGHEFDDYFEIENIVRITSSFGSYRRDKSPPINKSDDVHKYFLKALEYIPDEHIINSFMVVVNVELQSYFSVDQVDSMTNVLSFFFKDVKTKDKESFRHSIFSKNFNENVRSVTSSSFHSINSFQVISIKQKPEAKKRRGRPKSKKTKASVHKTRSSSPMFEGGCRLKNDKTQVFRYLNGKVKVIFPKQKKDDNNCALYSFCRALSHEFNNVSRDKRKTLTRGRIFNAMKLRALLEIPENDLIKFSHLQRITEIALEKYEIDVGIKVYIVADQKLQLQFQTTSSAPETPEKKWVSLLHTFPVENHYGAILSITEKEKKVKCKHCRINIFESEEHECDPEIVTRVQSYFRRSRRPITAPSYVKDYGKICEKEVLPSKDWPLKRSNYSHKWQDFGVIDVETFMDKTPGDADWKEGTIMFHRPYAVGFLFRNVFRCFKGPNCVDEFLKEFGEQEITVCGFNNGRYDNYFFLRNYLRNRKNKSVQFIIDTARVMCLRVGKLKFVDLAGFIPSSLDSACKSFGVPQTIAKGKFSHQLITSFEDVDCYENVVEVDDNVMMNVMKFARSKRTYEEWEKMNKIEILAMCIQEFKEFKSFRWGVHDNAEKLSEMHRSLMDFNQDAHEVFPNPWKKYLENDCRCTFWLACKLQDTFAEVLKNNGKVPWIFDSPTISSFAYLIWRYSLRESRLAAHAIEIPNCELKYNFIRAAMYGGAVTNFFRNYQSVDSHLPFDQIKDSLVYLDVNSLYPSAQMGGFNLLHAGEDEEREFIPLYPVGPSFWSDNAEADYCNDVMGFYFVEVFPPDDLLIPIIPQRKKEFQMGYVKENDLRTWTSSGLIRSLLPFKGIYSSVLLKLGEKFGYKYKFQSEALVYKECIAGLFDCARKIHKMKNAEDEKKDRGEPFNPAMRLTTKLVLNAGYGQQCMKTRKDKKVVISSIMEMMNYLEKGNIVKFSLFTSGEKIKKIIALFQDSKFDNTRPTQNGVLILDYSKCIYFSHLYRICGRKREDGTLKLFHEYVMAYGDTDSAIIHADYAVGMEGKGLGQMVNEKPDCKIICFRSNGPKSYLLTTINAKGEVKYEGFRFKGIPRSCWVRKDSKNDHRFDPTKDKVFDEKTVVSFSNNFKRNLNIKGGNQFLTFTSVESTRTIDPTQFKSMRYDEDYKVWFPFGYNMNKVDSEAIRKHGPSHHANLDFEDVRDLVRLFTPEPIEIASSLPGSLEHDKMDNGDDDLILEDLEKQFPHLKAKRERKEFNEAEEKAHVTLGDELPERFK